MGLEENEFVSANSEKLIKLNYHFYEGLGEYEGIKCWRIYLYEKPKFDPLLNCIVDWPIYAISLPHHFEEEEVYEFCQPLIAEKNWILNNEGFYE